NPTEGQVVKFEMDSIYTTFQPMALNYRNNLDQLQQISMIQNVQGIPNDNKFNYPNAYGTGIDLEYKYETSFLKENLIINSSNDLINPEQYILDGGNVTLDLDFILSTNSNKIIIDGVEWDKSTSKETSNEVLIRDDSGNMLYKFYKPYAFDSNGSSELLTYQFKKQGNSLFVVLKTPYSWLNDSSRVYPVYIDPTEGPNNPGTMADDATVGTFTWASPDNAKVSDNSYSSVNFGSAEDMHDNEVKIVKSDGTLGSENKALVPGWSSTEAYFSYGDSSDLWGESWTTSDINDTDFGVVLSAKQSTKITHYLKATNFGFSIPGEAIIDGILLEVERKEEKFVFSMNVTNKLFLKNNGINAPNPRFSSQ
ncbi:hypothetical protein LCGC14_2648690, partial [marine sediment metagenome]